MAIFTASPSTDYGENAHVSQQLPTRETGLLTGQSISMVKDDKADRNSGTKYRSKVMSHELSTRSS